MNPNATDNTSDLPTDQATVRSYCLGSLIIIFCIPGLIGNILVSYIEIKKRMLSSHNSSMYKLSFNLIVADSVHLALLTFYLGPSSILQDWLLPDNWTREIPGKILMIVWYNMLIDLCLLGLNRYLAICKPQIYATAFSKRNTLIMIMASWILAMLVCAIGELFLPCCKLYMYYLVYSYAFLDQDHTNYNDIFVLLPANTITSVLIAVMYTSVIYNIRVTNNKIADKLTAQSQQRRRKKEVRYALQLSAISAVFVAVWVLFNIFANVIPTEDATSGYFSVVIVLEIINASANSFVCIFFNREIKNAVKEIFGCSTASTMVTAISVKTMSVQDTSNQSQMKLGNKKNVRFHTLTHKAE